MSEVRALNGLEEVDRDARLRVEESLTPGQHLVIGYLGPVKTGFGTRLHVPLSESQIDDPGIFIELTYAQALDLNAKLAAKLSELAREH